MPPRAEPKRPLSLPTVIICTVGLLIAAILLALQLQQPDPQPVHTRDFSTRIGPADLDEWLLAAESLIEQRAEGKFTYKSRTLSGFLVEMKQQENKWSGKLDLVTMSFERFLEVTEAIRFARSKLGFVELQRERKARAAERMGQMEVHGTDKHPLKLPQVRPAKFKAGAQSATAQTYRTYQDRIERVLDKLELRVR